MDLQALSAQGQISLLTIPRESSSSSSSTTNTGSTDATSTTTTTNNERNDDTTAPLLLLQLPVGWKVEDLLNSKFVGTANTTQVALVVESKAVSFSLNRCETSNVLIMVPPTSTTTTTTTTTNYTSNKRSKRNEATGKTVTTVPARLLKPGGSGASFLELREKTLLLYDLRYLLRGHVFNPYDYGGGTVMQNPYSSSSSDDNNNTSTATTTASTTTCQGRTVPDLAAHLQTTEAQVRQALGDIAAFLLPVRNDSQSSPTYYSLLSEEVQQEAFNSIVAALAECDECHDYAGAGLVVESLVQHAVDRMSPEESYKDAAAVVRHCLSTLLVNVADIERRKGSKVRLDVAKVRCRLLLLTVQENESQLTICISYFIHFMFFQVAVCVARRLFQKQTAPWEETLFMSRWQSEMPGVGNLYQVASDMLCGVAVDIDTAAAAAEQGDNNDERFFKYLAAEKLPTEPGQRFRLLFEEKAEWRLPELEPYMVGLADSSTPAELVLRYTTIGTASDGTKVYTKK
jgi:hypothetical protein